MSEAALSRAIQIAASKLGARLLRNTVGTLQDRTGRYVTFGLGSGSSDLIGWRPYRGVAQFLAIEVKTPNGRVRPEQIAFIEAVNRAGGCAGICRSVADAEALILGT